MKRVGGLLDRMIERENILGAFLKAARGRQLSPAVRSFRETFDRNVDAIQKNLRAGEGPMGAYSKFVIFDPKRREIHAASFQERVRQHAIIQVCGPILQRSALHYSFACRKGRGTLAAVKWAQRCSRRHGFFLKLDVARYFDSIRHDLLEEQLARLFREREVLNLFRRVLGSYHTTPGRGIPIGTLTSQYLANFFLDPMDHWITQQERPNAYARYMDDFALWGSSLEEMPDRCERIRVWLMENCGLTLKSKTHWGRCQHGMEFLGFRVRNGQLLAGRRMRRRYRARLMEHGEAYVQGRLDDAGYQRRLMAATAYVKQANGVRWRGRILRSLPQFEDL